jgi:tetratricopeptide (TPR) repeat protein
MRGRAAEEAGARDEAIARFREAVAIRFDEQASREALIADAIVRGETDLAMNGIEAFLRLGSDHTRFYVRAAELYDALSRPDEAMGAFRIAMDLSPEDADVRVAYGRALLRAGQSDLAIEVLREALALRPTDVGTRELLEGMEPAERRDESFAVSSEELLSRCARRAAIPFAFSSSSPSTRSSPAASARATARSRPRS